MAGVTAKTPGGSPPTVAATAIGVGVVTKPRLSWVRDRPVASVVSTTGRIVACPLVTCQATAAPGKGLVSLPVRVTSRESWSESAKQPDCRLPPVTARNFGVMGAADSPHAASAQSTAPSTKLLKGGEDVLMAPPARGVEHEACTCESEDASSARSTPMRGRRARDYGPGGRVVQSHSPRLQSDSAAVVQLRG